MVIIKIRQRKEILKHQVKIGKSVDKEEMSHLLEALGVLVRS